MQLWLRSAEKFRTVWNFPNVIGAIDGKHVRIKCPKNSGSLFYNYKNFFSVVLLAIVDADYKFVAIDVGAYGKTSDSEIFGESTFGRKMKENRFNIPPPASVGNGRILPHVLLGDEAFALDLNMMKPYSQKTSRIDETKRIFNYRLSRARRTTENAFGILCQVFRVFFQPIAVEVQTADDLVVSACILHNMLREEDSRVQHGKEDDPTPELQQKNLCPLECTRSRHHSKEAEKVRQQFTEYFYGEEGSVPWQLQTVRRTGQFQRH